MSEDEVYGPVDMRAMDDEVWGEDREPPQDDEVGGGESPRDDRRKTRQRRRRVWFSGEQR